MGEFYDNICKLLNNFGIGLWFIWSCDISYLHALLIGNYQIKSCYDNSYWIVQKQCSGIRLRSSIVEFLHLMSCRFVSSRQFAFSYNLAFFIYRIDNKVRWQVAREFRLIMNFQLTSTLMPPEFQSDKWLVNVNLLINYEHAALQYYVFLCILSSILCEVSVYSWSYIVRKECILHHFHQSLQILNRRSGKYIVTNRPCFILWFQLISEEKVMYTEELLLLTKPKSNRWI